MKTLLSLLLFLLIQNPIHSQTLHLILVANTSEPFIGKGCEIDMKQTENEWIKIASLIQYQTKVLKFFGNSFNMDSISQGIQKFTCEEKDIVIFQYSGHGFNKEDEKLMYPFMLIDSTGYSVELLHRELKEKKPKLLITIADCCNELTSIRLPLRKSVALFDDAELQTSNLKKLLSLPSGDILISASQKGQVAYQSPSTGGLFTYHFIKSLRFLMNYSTTISWYNLLEDVKNRVSQFVFILGQQVPVYAININEPDKSSFNAVSFVVLNEYLNNLLIPQSDVLPMLLQADTYFDEGAKVHICSDTSSVISQTMTIPDYLNRCMDNGGKIWEINTIENRSEFDRKKKKYKEITVQEIWEE
jgi:hypothetical protein